MIGWIERRRERARARRSDRVEGEIREALGRGAERRRRWGEFVDSTIEELSHEPRPLNDLFARGVETDPNDVLLYIAALERRVDRLETPAPRDPGKPLGPPPPRPPPDRMRRRAP